MLSEHCSTATRESIWARLPFGKPWWYYPRLEKSSWQQAGAQTDLTWPTASPVEEQFLSPPVSAMGWAASLTHTLLLYDSLLPPKLVRDSHRKSDPPWPTAYHIAADAAQSPVYDMRLEESGLRRKADRFPHLPQQPALHLSAKADFTVGATAHGCHLCYTDLWTNTILSYKGEHAGHWQNTGSAWASLPLGAELHLALVIQQNRV